MNPDTIKLGLLMLALLPLLVDNIRTGRVRNALLGVLLAAGVLTAFFGPVFGAPALKLSQLVGWLLASGALVALFAWGVLPGGTAKFLAALLPWFAFGDWLLVVAAGMLLAAAWGFATGRQVAIVPPVMAAALVVGLLPAFGVDLLGSAQPTVMETNRA